MEWYIFLGISAVVFIAMLTFAFIRAKSKYKIGRILDPTRIIFIGVVLSAIFLFIPVYWNVFKNNDCGVFETILIAVHNTIRLFIVDGEFTFVTESLKGIPNGLFKLYTVYFSVIFVLAPILTFGFVLSFFKNLSAYKQFISHYRSNAYIFSDLNEESLALAIDLYKNDEKRLLVFTNVFDADTGEESKLIEKAKELKAVCFKKEITTISFSHSKKSFMNFFLIGKDSSENTIKSLKIIEKFNHRKKTNVYVFTDKIESEMMLINCLKEGSEIRVRRVNKTQSLVLHNLYKNGFENIFKTAAPGSDGIKHINAVILGLGHYGTEMLKALSWFTQMDGYLAEIDVFDKDKNAESKFRSECTELMEFSGKLDIKGETRYIINIHSGIDVETIEFDKIIASLPSCTYAFVSLGEDGKNIKAAVKLRTLFEKAEHRAEIQSIVYNTPTKNALIETTNFKGQKYNIDFIGDIESFYSENMILNSEIENQALLRHKKWGNEDDFWLYNYNYKSSVASVIHRRMKVLCEIPGIDKNPDERTGEELWAIRTLEHKRWNAYMRSEGYSYGGTIEKSGRNDLAKKHNCLVPFGDLPLFEQEKDDN